jgi:hypothetical protein
VTHDVAPFSIVVGNPARLLRFRFSDEHVARVLQSEWWQLSPDELLSSEHLFRLPVSQMTELQLEELSSIGRHKRRTD